MCIFFEGYFELNVYKPVIAYNIIQSIQLLNDGMLAFNQHCLMGIQANETEIQKNVSASLMLVTALNDAIGYDKAAEVAKKAHQEHSSIRDACLALGILDEQQLDELLNPSNMIPTNEDEF